MRSGASGFTGILGCRCLHVCARGTRRADRVSLGHRHPFDDDNVGASLQMGVGVLEAGTVGRIRAGADGDVVAEALLCSNSPVVHHLDHHAAVHGPDISAGTAKEVDAFVAGRVLVEVSRGGIVEGVADNDAAFLRNGPQQPPVVGGVGPMVSIGRGVDTQAVMGTGNGHVGSPCCGPDSAVWT